MAMTIQDEIAERAILRRVEEDMRKQHAHLLSDVARALLVEIVESGACELSPLVYRDRLPLGMRELINRGLIVLRDHDVSLIHPSDRGCDLAEDLRA